MAVKEPITPQMYGAKGDGKTDDTEAFQKAVNSGYDVYVPTSNRETYLIKRTIKITNPNCKRIYSEPFSRRASLGCIIADFGEETDPQNTPLFDIKTQLFLIGGLRIVGRSVDGHRAGTLIRAIDQNVCDYDIRVEHCSFTNFYLLFEMIGRGLEILSSHLTSSQYLANLYWDDSKDSNKNHPPMYDQRGICVKNCRLHNIASGFINVKSGHAYGLHFTGNTVDNGRGYLIKAAEQAYGWNITNNVIQGINGRFDFMEFKAGMRNCVISGNTFLADDGYWVGSLGFVNSWLKCGGNTTGCIIGNNIFKNTETNFMTFGNLDASSITGNSMYNKTKLSGAAINITGTCKRTTFVGNVTAALNTASLLAKSLPKGNIIIGNYPG